MKTVTVKANSKTYPVLIGNGIMDECGNLAKNITATRYAAIITDDIVDGLYSARLISSLNKAGFKTVKYVIQNGEHSKNTENYVKILEFLAESGLTRSDIVIALGGGVVGDIAGFAAASYLRGVHFIQVPTTLLACVDSSVGGKTGINLKKGKNLAGAFYQPDLVVCDPLLLSTLPENIFSDGCAEVIKYAVIRDKSLFELLKLPIKPHIEDIIARCVEIKSSIVEADEYDTWERQILNFGHTFGHAIEKCSGYAVSHGSAVAIGMAMMALAAADKGIFENDCPAEIINMVKLYSLPYKTDYSADALFDVLLADKKRLGETITLVVPQRIGECILKKVPVSEAKDFLYSAMKG